LIWIPLRNARGAASRRGLACFENGKLVAHPKQIILFGSYARGKITENSDLDVLIVAGDEVENTRRESVRLRGALKEIEMPNGVGSPESKPY
jgi:predicted nucleotidyltransferase